MKATLLLSVLLQMAPTPTEVVVGRGESLAQVARRTLGDERCASELKALNGLKDEKVAPGTTLKLPGPDRAQALTALATARNAVNHAKSQHERRQEAVNKLKEAETHFQSARYREAAQTADGAVKLVWSNKASGAASFQVAVAENGATTVISRSGPPVRVEAEGVTRPVSVGESVQVQKGSPPPPPRPPLAAPELLKPAQADKLDITPIRGGLPITLAWRTVEGAERYQVELVAEPSGRPQVHTVQAAQVNLALSAGRYRWSVRALTQETRSEPSAARSFELVEKAIRLEIRGGSNWK